jgi:ADP-ribose pyrophosphatase YjhB (NUDIX family)
MNFCSSCGSPDIRSEVPQGDTFERNVCGQCAMVHYSNPKMIVGCLVVSEDKVLLCRRAIEPRYGLWNLPCGFLENGETVEQGALRETWEEALVKVRTPRLHCIYNIPKVDQVYIILIADLMHQAEGKTTESLEVEFFAEQDIPWHDIAFTSTSFALKKYFEYRGQLHVPVHIGTFHNFASS